MKGCVQQNTFTVEKISDSSQLNPNSWLFWPMLNSATGAPQNKAEIVPCTIYQITWEFY